MLLPLYYSIRGEYLRLSPSPAICEFWRANETSDLDNAG